MSSEKTLAIVLKVTEFSETSSVVTLMTEDFGKITGLAKGARRPKGPFEAALDLLAVCRIVFLHKRSEALDLLTEAKLQRRFQAARHDLSRLYAGYYVAELLRELTDEGDPHPELFQTADQTLLALDNGDDPALQLLRFELTALRQLGHLPMLTQCAECGEPIPGDRSAAFGQTAGGVLCETHRVGKRQVVRISSRGLHAMQALSDASEDWRDIEWASKVRGELRGVLNQYFANLLGKRPRMHQYLSQQARSK
jgi:DNA repair protein RecO (recombination protein O)